MRPRKLEGRGKHREKVQSGTSMSPRSSRSRRAKTVGAIVVHVVDVEKLVLVLPLVFIIDLNYEVVEISCVLFLAG